VSISVTKLSKNYGAQKAVNNISFNVGQGEIVGFLGPNGAGKSTTMKMITGYLAADAGDIRVCGITANEQNTDTKKKIGYLPEANPLYMDMYVREYLQFISNVHDIKDARTNIESVIKTVGLTLEAHKKIGQLSKGYKQRVGLAAALVHNPEVLILDEPTSGLDPNQIVEIRNVIKNLSAEKTILFSSHIMQEVEALCDRVIIINKGNIVADDRLSNLKKNSGSDQRVIVEFKENVSPASLEALQGVANVEATTPQLFNLQCADAEAVKKQLMQLSLEKGINIVSLKSESRNLENVFKSLTT
jgi:ABC-2 type transport system ATP-binding protein